jgi:hypothetical protein
LSGEAVSAEHARTHARTLSQLGRARRAFSVRHRPDRFGVVRGAEVDMTVVSRTQLLARVWAVSKSLPFLGCGSSRISMRRSPHLPARVSPCALSEPSSVRADPDEDIAVDGEVSVRGVEGERSAVGRQHAAGRTDEAGRGVRGWLSRAG